jgi:prepilin-type N-terminal cleavage/methylation domain-containing protein
MTASINKKGFTLIEMLVSVAIFSVVMVMSLGALLALSTADRKAEALKSGMDDLNFALDSMSRSIRTGYAFHCASPLGQDCLAGSNEFVFTGNNGVQTYYRLDSTNAGICNQTAPNIGCIETSTDGVNWAAITAPNVVVCDLSSAPSGNCPQFNTSVPSYLFYVYGSLSGIADSRQPIVTMTISGYVQVSTTQQTAFHLQTSVTQRIYDQ